VQVRLSPLLHRRLHRSNQRQGLQAQRPFQRRLKGSLQFQGMANKVQSIALIEFLVDEEK
jgi:hypothetical protein